MQGIKRIVVEKRFSLVLRTSYTMQGIKRIVVEKRENEF